MTLHEQTEILASQKQFSGYVAEIMRVRATGACPLAFVQTYGCQQNVADGEKIKGMLADMGFAFTENKEEADFILFNTCAIREHAEDRVFGNIGALKNIKNRRPSLLIAVCGCMMEQEHVAERIKKSFPFVNIVFGTHVIHKLPELIYTAITNSERVFLRGGEQPDIIEGLPIRRDGNFRAWVTVMYGCNNFCSYCVVPYVRGREKSRRAEDVFAEVQGLVQSGYREITLLGQNVNSYGSGTTVNFAQLLRKLDQIPGEYVLRFMTSHPKDASEELFQVIAESTHICHHIHLPFQSGNDRVLKEMNRKYDRAQYLALIAKGKKWIPDLSLTSDVIVGFPGETYAEFCETLSLVKEVGFTSLFTFIFSPRVGTKAEKLPDPIPYEQKSAWFSELLSLQEGVASARCKDMLGKTERVLIEGKNEKNGFLMGRTGGSIVVEFPGELALIGTFQVVKITEARNWMLRGEMILV